MLTPEERRSLIEQLVAREQLKLARIRTVCALLIVAFWSYTTLYGGC
jgi:hypothetical protein